MNKIKIMHQQPESDTYLSTFNRQQTNNQIDNSIFKAIKQNNVSYIVDKSKQNNSQSVEKYNLQQQLHNAVVQLRKKYDQQKDQSLRVQKNIQKMQEMKDILLTEHDKLMKQKNQMKNNLQMTEQQNRNKDYQAQYLQFIRDIRLNTQDTLKKDIIYYRKQCFQNNIDLVKIRSQLKQVSQRAFNKKHLNTKCKLILNSLQDTVKNVQKERSIHLQQLNTMYLRKMQNSQLKNSRQQFLLNSLKKAQVQKLPQQIQMMHKLNAQLFAKKLLRSKMNKIMLHYKDIQTCFNIIKKSTRVQSIHQFIQEYLNREKKYGQLLEKVQKCNTKINYLKDETKVLQKQNSQLQNVSFSLQNIFDQKSNKHQILQKSQQAKYIKYTQKLKNIQKSKIILRRWTIKTILKYRNIQNNYSQNQNQKYTEDLQKLSLKQVFCNLLKIINKTVQDIDIKDKSQKKENKEGISSLSTYRSEQKINLRTLRTQLTLSKDMSSRNFRIKTMVQADQPIHENDVDYDEVSERDFLRHNRRMVKKNNIKNIRSRIKTRPF